MTAEQRFERSLPALLEELGESSLPDYRDSLLGRTAAMRQRPAWTFPERWIPMDTTLRRVPAAPLNWRLLALAALLIIAAATIAVIAASSNRRLPAPPYGPAANGMMAYSFGGDIYLADPVTGMSRSIASGPEIDKDPVFSPDGEHIIWVRGTGQGSHGVLADADGTNIRDLLGPPCRECTAWGWMADSQSIFVTSNVAGRDITIENVFTRKKSVIDVPGEIRRIGFRPPDDAQIAYVEGSLDEGYDALFDELRRNGEEAAGFGR